MYRGDARQLSWVAVFLLLLLLLWLSRHSADLLSPLHSQKLIEVVNISSHLNVSWTTFYSLLGESDWKGTGAMTETTDLTEAVPANNIVVSKPSGVPVPDSLRRPIYTKPKILMGSGPTNYTQRVIESMAKPLTGLYSKEYYQVMDEVKEGLQYLFQTTNPVTFCTTGSGGAGMETVLSNLIEEGDVVLIAVTGAFGHRAINVATRYGADVRILEAKLGQSLKYEQISAHIEAHKPKLLFIVHGDSSTGVLQQISKLGELCHRNNCLLIVDAVASFGAVEILVDEWQIDAAFAASQKAIGAPSGLAPVTFSPRAVDVISARKTPPPVYYYDVKYLASKWNCFNEKRL